MPWQVSMTTLHLIWGPVASLQFHFHSALCNIYIIYIYLPFCALNSHRHSSYTVIFSLSLSLPTKLACLCSVELIDFEVESRKYHKMGVGSGLVEALNVRVVGSGRRILVLSHGFGTDQSVWQRILPYFVRDFRIVLYDLMCAGSVNPDNFDFQRYSSLYAYADDLITILEELNVDNCIFLGHSLSAMIGCMASVKRPELFAKLVLFGASPRYSNDSEYEGGFERKDIEKVFGAMESNYAAWVSGFAPLAVGGDVPVAVREFSRTLFNMRPDIALYVAKIIFETDMRGILGQVKVPCCVIQTSKDMAVPMGVAMYVKKHLGCNATLEILDTEGHLPHLSQPAKIIQLLKKVLQ